MVVIKKGPEVSTVLISPSIHGRGTGCSVRLLNLCCRIHLTKWRGFLAHYSHRESHYGSFCLDVYEFTGNEKDSNVDRNSKGRLYSTKVSVSTRYARVVFTSVNSLTFSFTPRRSLWSGHNPTRRTIIKKVVQYEWYRRQLGSFRPLLV